jgi:hypothetical protein
MSDRTPIEVVAARIARLCLAEYKYKKVNYKVGPGPVLTVVRNTITGKIYIGLNDGVPDNVSDALGKAIAEQGKRVWQGETVLVHTDPQAIVGGHSEVNALNPAIRDRQMVLGRTLTEKDLSVFELHNLWLTPSRRAVTVAPRCEHCARITRGVTVTQSVFVAEGGVMGEINVPQRGLVIRSGSSAGTPATTAAGEVDVPQRGSVIRSGSSTSTPVTAVAGEVDVAQRGSVVRSGGRAGTPVTTASGSIGESEAVEGGGMGGAVAGGIVSGVFTIAGPFIKRWIFKTFMENGWTEDQRAQVTAAIERMTPALNVLVQSHSEQIQKAKSAGRWVKLRIDVDTDWFDTSYGPYQAGAYVSYWDLVFQGDTEVEWPLFQPNNFWHKYFQAQKVSTRRQTFYIVL